MPAQIKKETVDFLKQLKKNNNRDWFNKNKERYQDALDNFTEFIGSLIEKTSKFDKSVGGLEPKKCVFRIYRDVRFSKDKSPYKSHFGAHLIGGGKQCGRAGYYIHFEPGSVFLAGGLHMPDPARLKGVRDEISYNAKQFTKIINDKTFKQNFKDVTGDRLKTAPKGFDKADPMLHYLQFKDFIISHKVDDKTLTTPGFADYCVKIFKSMVPFNDFVNEPVK